MGTYQPERGLRLENKPQTGTGFSVGYFPFSKRAPISDLKGETLELENKVLKLDENHASYSAAAENIKSLNIHIDNLKETVGKAQRDNQKLLGENTTHLNEINRLTTEASVLNNTLAMERTSNADQMQLIERMNHVELAEDAEFLFYAESMLKLLSKKAKNDEIEDLNPLELYRDIEETLFLITERREHLMKSYCPRDKPFPMRTVKERRQN